MATFSVWAKNLVGPASMFSAQMASNDDGPNPTVDRLTNWNLPAALDPQKQLNHGHNLDIT